MFDNDRAWIIIILILLIVLGGAGACSSRASAGAFQSKCYHNEGCCIKGVQFRVDFFPICSSTRTIDCVPPGKAFLRASEKCKLTKGKTND